MKKILLSIGLVSLTAITGCVPLTVGVVATGTTAVAVDRRSVSDQTTDGLIETKASMQLTGSKFTSSHITATSYEGRVLLSGEVGTEEDKEKAGEIVKAIKDVSIVYNELAVMQNNPVSDRFSDSITASKVRSSLIDTKGITITAVKVVVDRSICYLMGTVTATEEEIIVKVASTTTGVTKVVNLLTVISQDELNRREKKNAEEAQQANVIKETTIKDTGETSSSDVEVNPI